MVRTVRDYSTSPISLYAQFAQYRFDKIDPAGSGTGAGDAAFFVDENVGWNSSNFIGGGDGSVRIVEIGERELVPVHEFAAGGFGGVELGCADNVDAGVAQFVAVERGNRGQLPRAVWSPGRPEYQQSGCAKGVGEFKHGPIQGLRLELYRLIAVA